MSALDHDGPPDFEIIDLTGGSNHHAHRNEEEFVLEADIQHNIEKNLKGKQRISIILMSRFCWKLRINIRLNSSISNKLIMFIAYNKITLFKQPNR